MELILPCPVRLNALSEVGNIGMLDVNRGERSGVPEVVLAETKAISYLTNIVEIFLHRRAAFLQMQK